MKWARMTYGCYRMLAHYPTYPTNNFKTRHLITNHRFPSQNNLTVVYSNGMGDIMEIPFNNIDDPVIIHY